MKPRILDLYCGAGGAARGLQRAGFYAVGVDNRPQPHYCGDEFILGDALEVPLEGYDAYWASPPCQHATMAGQQWRKAGRVYPDLIAPTRERLKATGKPYIIENVTGAALLNPVVLNGATFGLLLRRTRLFECSFPMPVQELIRDPVGHFSNVNYARKVMDIDWMTGAELTQAIPPVYSEFMGLAMLRAMGL